jgi:hypothetical protein
MIFSFGPSDFFLIFVWGESHFPWRPKACVWVMRATAIAVALGNLFGGKFVDSGVMFPSLTVLIPENGGEF